MCCFATAGAEVRCILDPFRFQHIVCERNPSSRGLGLKYMVMLSSVDKTGLQGLK